MSYRDHLQLDLDLQRGPIMLDYCVSSVKDMMTCGEVASPMFWLVSTLCYYFTRVVVGRTSRSV
jgi:hypothetical protein